jgi:uncharacterized protein YndB with AHSA1/START domain
MRILDAPRDLVFQALTEPERLRRWRGPHGCTVPVCTIALRRGASCPAGCDRLEGRDSWCTGVYRDVVAPERIVCPACCAEEEGNLVAPAHDGLSAAWPAETLVTVTFAGHAGTTRLTLQQSVLVRRPSTYAPSVVEVAHVMTQAA